jgi:hypothetical protein
MTTIGPLETNWDCKDQHEKALPDKPVPRLAGAPSVSPHLLRDSP